VKKTSSEIKPEKRKRIYVDMSEESAKKLQELVNSLGISRVGIIRRALGWFEWLVIKLKGGYKVVLKKDGKEIEIEFLDLSGIVDPVKEKK